MKFLLIMFMIGCSVSAQELFVMTEPASNMPTGSIGARLGQSFMKEQFESGYNYHLMPDLCLVSTKI